MIDPDLVTRKMVLITADVNALAPFARKTVDDYVASSTDELVVERYLERMIGRMIDINYHLVTEAGHPPPRDYYHSFTELARIRVLPADFATRIAACSGLRNRLVHEYDEIDPARVYEALQSAVRDVPEYLNYVQEHLAKAVSS
ncbi:MAG: type VII toxin-antitoxin system HepT family RNase toxin [Candidatus Binatia bacterium]